MLDPRVIPTRLYPERERRVPIAGPRPPARWRLWGIARLLMWFTLHWIAGRLARSLRPAISRRIRAVMEHYGGAWVKAGQLVAMRRDLFSEDLCDTLAELQDRVAGFPGSVALGVIEADLQVPWTQVFSEFVQEPIAAGSVGQVHHARLLKGTEVAVKVQRPGIEEAFDADLRWIERIVRLFRLLRIMPQARWHEFAWELEQMFANELDYRGEAASQADMRERLRHHNIYVPRVFFKLTTQRVLVMEFISGVQMTEFIEACEHDPGRLDDWLEENNIQPKRVGFYLYETHTRQVFEDNLFHGDLHPGNIVLLRDSRIALIDFGSVGSIDTTRLRKYYMLFQAIAQGAFEKAADMLLLLSPEPPGAGKVPVKAELIRLLKIWRERSRIHSLPYHEKSLTTLMAGFAVVLQRHKIPATWEFMRVNRAEVTMDSSLAYLFPEIDYFKMIRGYEERARRREIERAFSCDNTQSWMMRAVQVVEAIDTAGERAYFDTEWVRQRAQLVITGASKLALAGAAALDLLMRLATASLFVLPVLFIYQRGFLTEIAAWLEITELLNRFPPISVAALIGSWIALVYLRVGMGRLQRLAKEPQWRGEP